MVAQGNVGVAFAMVIGGGLATVVGALIVFCIKLATPRLLASSLGFSAGVMIYVCFAEIMKKSNNAFQALELSVEESYRYTTCCFFGGMVVIAILDKIVHLLTHHSDYVAQFFASPVRGMVRIFSRRQLEQGPAHEAAAPGSKQHQHQHADAGSTGSECGDGSSQADAELGCCDEHSACGCPLQETSGLECKQQQPEEVVGVPEGAAAVLEVLQNDPHAFELQKMGVLTALAMAIHNFPEGLATFVGALSDVKVGAGIACAIIIHNIPEGICVAMPIYYATGSRLKAFLWAALPGLLEPLGGLIGYLALHDNNDLAFAIVFGLVSGMMVYISIRELIPAAFRYDRKDFYASGSVVVGMVVMAASLLLFQI